MAKVPHGVEILPKISIAWVGRTNVTDKQTTDDRQTDGPSMTYSEHELEFTFAKNGVIKLIHKYEFANRLSIGIKISEPEWPWTA